MSLEMLHKYPPSLITGEGFLVFNRTVSSNDFYRYWPIFANTDMISDRRMTLSSSFVADLSCIESCPIKPFWLSKKPPVQTSYILGHHIWKHEYDAQQQLHWMKIILFQEEGECVIRRIKYAGAYAQGWIDKAPVLVVKEFRIIRED